MQFFSYIIILGSSLRAIVVSIMSPQRKFYELRTLRLRGYPNYFDFSINGGYRKANHPTRKTKMVTNQHALHNHL